ncbi:MAG: GNAT family N-acetyltransferase [Acidimicrobiia bacterium]|nr:GNAT family N-acetyltransferase [Acidimicrobiia bacterium]
MTASELVLRAATVTDAARLAELHATRISEGFLSQLGTGFLRRLYRRVIVSPEGFVVVAVADYQVVGFAAGALDVGRLYRSFLVRDGIAAGLVTAPRLLRSWRRVLETLRYPTRGEDLPAAEILAVAVEASAAGRGIGRRLVTFALDEFIRRGTTAAKVVAGADNAAALGLYAVCGFVAHTSIAVHRGTPSEVLVWSSR